MTNNKELDKRRSRVITRKNIPKLTNEMGVITEESLINAQFTPIVHAYLYSNLEPMKLDGEVRVGSRSERPYLISLRPIGWKIMSRLNGRRTIDVRDAEVRRQTFDFTYRCNYTKVLDHESYSEAGLALGILTGHPLLGAFLGDAFSTTTYLTERHRVHIYTPGLVLEPNGNPPIGIVPIPTRFGPLNQDSEKHFDTWKFRNYDLGLFEDWAFKPKEDDLRYQDLLFSLFVLVKNQKMPINLVSDWQNLTNSIL